MHKVVINSTPLIALAHINKLHLLNKLYGEVEVMILAKEVCSDLVVIDDKNAKKHAKYLGLNVTGTLGILIKAKQKGFIKEVKPLLLELKNKGIYISDNVIDMCLKAANEK